MASTYRKEQGIVRICGDYCAWHETSIYVDYIFGSGDEPECFEDEIAEWKEEKGYVYDNEKYDYDKPLTPEHIDEMEEYLIRLVDEDDGDYSDYEIQTILIETRPNGSTVPYIVA